MRLRTAIAVLAVGLVPVGFAGAQEEAPLDPAHNLALPCEVVSTPGGVPRAAKNIVHVANVCGFVGTDMEFQSRMANDGLHDYAFVGTMGGGTRIFDVTDPSRPKPAGRYFDPGWQNDVHVRGDTLVVAFDWLLVGAHVSECLKQKQIEVGSFEEGGVDVVRLAFDPQTATFQTSLVGCYLSEIPAGGAHTVTLHPSGQWLSQNTAFSGGIEVVDLRGPEPTLARRITRDIVDQAHDVSFSRDGNTLYSAGVSSTRIVDVRDIFNRAPTLIAEIKNAPAPDGHTIDISHQSDTSSDGAIFVVTDEAGGGLSETGCNTDPEGKIGGAHFWSLADPSAPTKLGTWFYPNPVLAPDPLQDALEGVGRTERACTIHVFRNGGNGSAGPGPIAPGFDGVSSLPSRQLVTAHYGAGVWHLDFSRKPSSADGIAEEPRTTWGNTLGWNVMPGAETWSAKEYKGFIYAGDMGRGFDVYGFKTCEGLTCVATPNTPGKATGGGQIEGQLAELTILRGTAAGGRASFGFNAEFAEGVLSGHLTYIDHGSGKKVQSTAIDSFTVAGNVATFTGRANVNGSTNVPFTVEVTDGGEPGSADAFSIVLATQAYSAAGALLRGNIQVQQG